MSPIRKTPQPLTVSPNLLNKSLGGLGAVSNHQKTLNIQTLLDTEHVQSAKKVLSKRHTQVHNSLLESTVRLIENKLDTYFKKAVKKNTHISDIYDTHHIHELIDRLMLSLEMLSLDKDSVKTINQTLENISQQIIAAFIDQQNTLFRKHYPHFQKILDTHFKDITCFSLKNLEENILQLHQGEKDTFFETIHNSIHLITVSMMVASMGLVIVKKLKDSPSSTAQLELITKINDIENKINSHHQSLDTLIIDLKKELEYLEGEDIQNVHIDIDICIASKEELLRTKRFLANIVSTLSMASKESISTLDPVTLWAKYDLNAFICVLEDKIRIAQLIGDDTIKEKLQKLKRNLHMMLYYPHTLYLGKISESKRKTLTPTELKKILFDHFSNQLKAMGIPDKKEDLLQSVDQKYFSDKWQIITIDTKKIFWVPYPELKKAIDTLLIALKNIEALLKTIDKTPKSSMRPRQSYSRELIELLEGLNNPIQELKNAFHQAHTKAQSKKNPIDFTITGLIEDILNNLPRKDILQKEGYIL